MKYRNLGKTGMKVSEVGFGCWGIGGNSYGDVDDGVSTASLKLAFEKGVNFFDTSELYGNGHSEELIGDVFKGNRDKIIIASKGGTLPHSGFYMPQDFSGKYLRKALEGTLKRLKTDYVDLYQLHSPYVEDLVKYEDALSALQTFKEEGKIREMGVSARSPGDAKMFVEKYNIPVLQLNFNMIDQRARECGFFDLAAERNTGVIVRTPLVFGYLTGKMTGEEKLTGQDHRKNWPMEQLKLWADSSNLFSFLVSKDRTCVQAALRFCLDQKSVSTVIPGMLETIHVEENTKASEIPPLNEDELRQIQEIYKTHEFYDKNAKSKGKA